MEDEGKNEEVKHKKNVFAIACIACIPNFESRKRFLVLLHVFRKLNQGSVFGAIGCIPKNESGKAVCVVVPPLFLLHPSIHLHSFMLPS